MPMLLKWSLEWSLGWGGFPSFSHAHFIYFEEKKAVTKYMAGIHLLFTPDPQPKA